jgi:putative transposase
MDGYLRLSPPECKTCLAVYRADRSVRRALVLLLLTEGRSYRDIGLWAFVSPTLVASVKRDYAAGGVERALGRQANSCVVASWLILVARWLISLTPRDFGFFRSRWSCALLAMLLWQEHRVRLSPETVRRGLHQLGFVWRRPRPVVGPRERVWWHLHEMLGGEVDRFAGHVRFRWDFVALSTPILGAGPRRYLYL